MRNIILNPLAQLTALQRYKMGVIDYLYWCFYCLVGASSIGPLFRILPDFLTEYHYDNIFTIECQYSLGNYRLGYLDYFFLGIPALLKLAMSRIECDDNDLWPISKVGYTLMKAAQYSMIPFTLINYTLAFGLVLGFSWLIIPYQLITRYITNKQLKEINALTYYKTNFLPSDLITLYNEGSLQKSIFTYSDQRFKLVYYDNNTKIAIKVDYNGLIFPSRGTKNGILALMELGLFPKLTPADYGLLNAQFEEVEFKQDEFFSVKHAFISAVKDSEGLQDFARQQAPETLFPEIAKLAGIQIAGAPVTEADVIGYGEIFDHFSRKGVNFQEVTHNPEAVFTP